MQDRHLKATTGEERCCVNKRGAPSQHEAAQGIVRHTVGASGVNMRGASSQRKAARGIARHMEGASGVNMRAAPS